MVAPTHKEVVPPPMVPTASGMVIFPLFHLSPASSVPLLFTALITPYIFTVPVPVAGAVQVILDTYVVPAPPDPELGDVAVVCSNMLRLPKV